MKSIKSKFIRGLSLLLALVVLLNIPISALASAVSEAAYVPTDDAIIQEMLGKGYDEDRAEMIAHDAFQALKYLGYDYDKYLEDNGLLFTKGYYGSKLLTNAPDSLTNIAWTNNGNGMQTTSSKSPYSNADSYTGKYPNVTKFEETGLDCADYVSYYYTNYLPNIAGVDVSVITDAMAYVMAKNNGMYGNDYSYMNFWDDAREFFVSQGVKVYQVTKSGSMDEEGNVTLDGNILEYIDPYGNKKTDDIFAELPIGTLIQMGEMPGDDYNQDGQTTRLIHYAVYAGSWTDPSTGKTQHYIAHSSNKKRGPEISTLYNMSPEANGTNKSSVAMYFYVFQAPEQYGSITIKKEGPDGGALAGAEFLIVNKETNEAYKIITDSDGIASQGELPLGTYTVTEVKAPPGYVKTDQTWTVTLTKEDPTGGGTITVVNEPDVGSLQILKEITPSSAAIPENLAGWQFKLYHNSPVKTASLNSSTANRSYRVVITDKYGNSATSNGGHMAFGPVITKQPTDQFTANGSTFTFSVTAENVANYQWEFSANSGSTWSNWTSSASTSSTFSRPMSDTMRNYQFRCKLTDSSGNVTYSNAVTPYYDTEFSITEQPKSLVSAVGDSATFTVGLSGSTSGATYKWQVSSNGGSSWTNVGTGATYVGKKTSTSLLKVRCVVTVNGVPQTSDVVDWVRADYKDASGNPAIYISEAPKDYVGKSGSTASFEVLAAGEGLVYQWEYKLDDADTWVPVEKAYSDEVYETDTSGKTTLIQNIPVGSYYIKELSVSGKENWDYDFPKAVEITTGTTVYVTFTNEQHTGGLKIQKATEDGKNLANWEFAIYEDKACTKLIRDGLFTGSAGTIIVDGLEPGMTVWVKEIGHKDSAIGDLYKVKGDNPKSGVVASDETVTIETFENVLKYGSIKIQKKTNTGKNLTGWRVNVYKGSVATANRIPGSPFTITDSSGILVIDNLEPGTYYVKEVNDGGDYWVCDTTARKVTVVAGQTVTAKTIENEQFGKLSIKKVMTDGSSPAGWQFNVYNSSNELIEGSPFKTDANGDAIGLSDILLEAGVYTIEEILVTDSTYTVVGSQKQTVTVECGVTAEPVIFENTPKLGSLQIQKKTSTGDNLAGWQFQIYKNSPVKTPYNTTATTNRYYRVRITDANGKTIESDSALMSVGANITKQPVSQAVAAGSSASFSVAAEGNDLTYQWQWKYPTESSWTNSSASSGTTNTLKFTMAASFNTRQYRCVITDGDGNEVYSDVANLYLPTTLAILEQPENAIVAQGEKTTFTVKASGSNLTYQWQTRNEDSTNWTNQSGATSATFITPAKGSMPLVYVRCEIRSGDSEPIYTDPVMWVLPEYDGENILILEQPKAYTSAIGSRARFDVVAVGKYLIYQWEYRVNGTNTWISSGDLARTGKYETDDEGYTEIISDLPCGSYYVKEVDTGLEDWQYDLTPKYVEISPDDYETTQKVTVTNIKIITGITIHKVTSDGKNLAGWIFSIYSDEACTKPIQENLKTNAKGLITAEDLPLGTVWVKEIGHELEDVEKLYYINSPNPQSATIENGVPAYVEFENILKSGSMQIIKQTNTGKELAGWQFRVYKNVTVRTPWNTTNTTNRSYRVKITDANGNVVYSNLAHMGTGANITKQPVSQAVAAGSSASFSVTAVGSNLTYQWQWKYQGESTWKDSSVTSATTDTLTFTMATPFDNRQFRCKITDGNGNEVYSDVANLYLPTTLAILEQPENAIVAQGEKTTFSVKASGSNLTYQWQTKNMGATSWSNQSGKTAATYSATKGAMSLIYVRCAISDGTDTIYTDPVIWALSSYDGEIIIVDQPKNYTCAIGKQAEFEIVAIGKDLVYQWEYQVDGSSTWINVDQQYQKVKYTTDSNGKTELISDMPTGSYYVVEINSGSAEWTYDETPKRVDIDVDNISEVQYVTFTNIKKTDLTIQKVTEDGENLEGWLFEIYLDQACTVLYKDGLVTDENGYITINNMEPGTYWVKEIGHKDSDINDLYMVNGSNPKSVTLVSDVAGTVAFENLLKYGSLVIQKQTNSGNNLDGWRVNVYTGSVATANRIPGSPFTITDPNGTLVIENLLPGTYWVKEVNDGDEYWVCDVTPQKVTIVAGKTADTVYINNTEYSKLSIKKVMADGTSPIGWSFNLYDSSNNLVDGSPFTVDRKNGTISALDDKLLLPGNYTVEEVISNGSTYMVVGSKTQTITLDAGVTTTVTFINEPKTGSLQVIKETNTGENLAGWQFQIYVNSPFRKPWNTDKTTNRSYRVKITDANGNVVYSDAAHMGTGANITKQPVSQAAAAGSSVTFSISAVGTDLTYQWQYQAPGKTSWTSLSANSAISAGSQTDTYTISNMQESMDGRKYRCKITDADGNVVYSDIAYLYLPTTLAILDQPKSAIVNQGDKTTFSVTASGSNLTYQWQSSNNSGASWSNLSGKTSATYTAAKGSMPKVLIRCIVSDGTNTLYTEPAIWVLKNCENQIVIVDQPKDYYGSIGKQALFEVSAAGKDLIYQWEYQKDGTSNWIPVETLYSDADVLTTDIYGKTEIVSDIPCGEYYIKEVDTGLENWEYDTSVKFFEVTPDNFTELQVPAPFVNTHYGVGQIYKYTNSGTVEGWIFEITDANGNPVKDAHGKEIGLQTTGSTGIIDLDLLPGTYYVREVGPNRGDNWLMDTTVKKLVVTAGKPSSVSFMNIMLGDAEIVKTTTNGGTLIGWTFTIENEDGEIIGTYTTTAENIKDGKAIITQKLVPGTYYVTETNADMEYWELDRRVQVIDVVADQVASVTFENKWFGKGQIVKTIQSGGSLVGWTFNVTDSNGDWVGTYTTTEDDIVGNKAVITLDLEPGDYTVEEIIPASSSYTVNGENPKTLTVVAGTTNSVTFENILKTGSLQVYKTTNTGENLAGWQFKVYKNSPVKTPYNSSNTTNRSYRVKITDKYGNVKYSSTAHMGEGIHISEHPSHQSLSAGSTCYLTVKAEGSGLTYQWQYKYPQNSTWTNSTSIANGAQSDTFKITMATPFNNRQYRCQITDENGNVEYSNPASLYLPTTLAILKQPENAVSAVGEKANFTVSVSGSNLTYKWQASSNGGSTWNTIGTNKSYSGTKSTTSRLLIRCVISDGTNTVTSATAQWLRSDYKDANGDSAIYIIEQPQNYVGPLGNRARFEVLAAGEDLVYQWEYQIDGTNTWLSAEEQYTAAGTLTTDETGKTQVVSGIPCGTYYVKEVNTGLDYWKYDSTPKAVYLPTTDTATVQIPASFYNEHYGKGQIIKETTNGGTLEGWIFEITDVNGNPVKDVHGNEIGLQTTGTSGIITLDLLPGTYYIREVGPDMDDYWFMDTETKVLVVEAGKTSSVTFINQWKGKGQIVKTTTNGGTLIGWIFEVRDSNGTLVGTYTTTADHIVGNKAIITIDLEPGTYTVKEIGPDRNSYWVMDTETKTLTVKAGATSSVSFLNQWRGKGQIVKTTTNGGTLVGWIFEVRDSNGTLVGTYTTTADHIVGNKAIITIDLEPGTYTIKEIGPEVDDYWVMDTEAKTLTVTAGATSSVSFQNQWRGKGQIVKTTTNGGTLVGWIFEVRDSNGTLIGTYTTTADHVVGNKAIITIDLEPGTYTVKEIGPEKDDYWVMDTESKTLSVTAGATSSVSFQNHWRGKGQIVKTTTNGGTLVGWIFEVRDSNGTLVGTYTTTADHVVGDKAIITIDMEPGTYTVKEIGPDRDSYWVMDTETKTLTVKAGATSSVSFLNQWRGKGQIVKTTTNGGTLVGWIFEVRDSNGTLVGTYTTTTDHVVGNKAIITIDLEPGTYTVKEIGPEKDDYWVMDTETKTLVVEAGHTSSASFLNQWKGKGQIVKTTTNGGTLVGWIFEVRDADGNLVGTYTTTSDHIVGNKAIITIDLEPGTYTVKEIGPDRSEYWDMDMESKTLVVTAGETTGVTCTNQWKGVGEFIKVMEDGTSPIGWQFIVTDASGNPIDGSPFTVTDKSGKIHLGKLEPGTYTVMEVIAADSKYKVEGENPKTLTIVAGETASVTFKNVIKTGSLQISKETNTGENLAGWQFKIYNNTPFRTPYNSGNITGRYYRVKITDANGNSIISNYAQLTAGPKITKQPENISVAAGTKGSFSVIAEGDNLSYQWQWTVNGGKTWNNSALASANESVLEFTMSSTFSGRQFRCLITDGDGNITVSNSATLYLPSDFAILEAPQSVVCKQGSHTTFTVKASGPDLTYQWQTSNDGQTWRNAGTGTSYSGTKGPMPRVWIKCLVYSSAASDPIEVNANWVLDTYEGELLLLREPQNHSCPTGTNGYIDVLAAGKELIYEWEFLYANQDPTDESLSWHRSEIVYKQNNSAVVLTTDENGKTEILSGIPCGSYYVREVNTGKELWIYDSTPKYVMLPTTDTVTVQTTDAFVNTHLGVGQIVKETTNGGTLIGWIFEVRDSNGNLVGTYTTTADHIVGNKAIIAIELEPGTYTVKEIGPTRDSYWTMDTETKTLVVEAGNTSSASFLNQWKGKGQIVKTTTNGGTLIGWIFEVRDADGNLVGTYSTTADHIVGDKAIITIDLEPGTYTVKEIGPTRDSYWTMDTQAKTLTVTAGSTSSVSFLNQWKGKGQLIKKTTNGGTLDGWKFEVKNANGERIGTYTTFPGMNGVITFDLEPGTYYVTEIGPARDDYWTMDTETKVLVVEAGKTSSVTFTNQWKGKGQIVKETTNGGTLIGWIFEVRDSNDTLVGTYTTAEKDIVNGKAVITFDLEPGTYYVKEVGPGMDDYWTMDTETKVLVVEAGQTSSASFLNKWTGRGQIVKKTTNGGTLIGWIFEVWDTDGNIIGTYTTAEKDIVNGKAVITFDLEPGTYYVKEVGPEMDEYWIMDTKVKTLIVEAGKTTSATFLNQWTGKAAIYKSMTDGSSPAGWQFKVVGPDGNEIPGSPFTTDNNGEIHISNLQPGKYVIEEIIPDGCLYQPVGDNPKTITVKVGETAPVTFENELRPGKLVIEKINEIGEHLAGAKFLLEWSTDGTTWTPVTYSSNGIIPGGCSSELLADGTLVTGESGRIEFLGLHPALLYRVTETEAPNGYVLLADHAFVGKLPVEDLTVQLIIRNDHVFIMPGTGVPAGVNTVLKASFVAVFALFMVTGAALVAPRVVSAPNPDENNKK